MKRLGLYRKLGDKLRWAITGAWAVSLVLRSSFLSASRNSACAEFFGRGRFPLDFTDESMFVVRLCPFPLGRHMPFLFRYRF